MRTSSQRRTPASRSLFALLLIAPALLTALLGVGGCQDGAARSSSTKTITLPPLAVALARLPTQERFLAELGLPITSCLDVLEGISRRHGGVVVCDAHEDTLKLLEAHRPQMTAFTDHGGWLVLCGLAPSGLAEFNRLMGVEHLMRPCSHEAVFLPSRVDPLLQGLDPINLLMLSDTRGVQGIPLRAEHVWSYVLDTGDIAPFSTIPDSEYWRPGTHPAAGTDIYPPNLVNGLDDNWQLGFTIPTDRPQDLEWTFSFPRPEIITTCSLIPDNIYRRITRIRLEFPGSAAAPIEYDVRTDTMAKQDFQVPNVHASGLRISIIGMTPGAAPVTGIRNLWIQVARSQAFRRQVRPLLSIGVLNCYPMGAGGVILDQMEVDHPSQFDNRSRQREIMRVLLSNLLRHPTNDAAHAVVEAASTAAHVPDANSIAVDDFRGADDIDDTQVIRNAVRFAHEHAFTTVRFSSRIYQINSTLQFQDAGGICLQGAEDADGHPATVLDFIVPTRISDPPYDQTLISGIDTRDILIRY